MPAPKNYKHLIIILILTAILLPGCKLLREVREVAIPDAMETEAIVDQLEQNQLDYEWFSARFTGSVTFDDGRNNISGSLRIKRDSAIFISIAPVLGIEVIRALITPSQVKFMNRMDATYYIGGIEKLTSLANTRLDFQMLQSMLTGNDFANFSSDRFVLSEESGMHLIHNPARKELNSGHTINHALLIDPAIMKIKRSTIKENHQNRSLQVNYISYGKIKEQWVPNEIRFLLTNNSARANLDLVFSRITIDEPQRIEFSIPGNYSPIDF